jgi:ATP-dependent exoDNAse (exonuclease V) alpha subunit
MIYTPELSLEQHIALLSEYVNEVFVKAGMVALVAIHQKDGNAHAHLLLNLRQVLPDGSFLPKAKGIPFVDEQGELIRGKNGKWKMRKVCFHDWNNQGNGEKWRKLWAYITNKHYKLAGVDIEIDHRSPKRQGLTQLSPVYMTQADHEREQCGEHTEVGALNRWIKAENQRRQHDEQRKRKIDRLLENYLTKVKGLSRREQYKSPQTRATQQFWTDLRAIEAQFEGKATVDSTSSSKEHHPQLEHRERDPNRGME